METYEGKSRVDLQAIANKRGLQVSGPKASIIERLVTYDAVKKVTLSQLEALANAEGIVLRKDSLADKKIEYVRKRRPVVDSSEGEEVPKVTVESLEVGLEETRKEIAQLRSLVLKLTKRVDHTTDALSKLVGNVEADVKTLRTELEDWSL